MTLTEFLLARITEREEAARDAAGWNAAGTERALGEWRRDGLNSVVDEGGRLVVNGDGPAPYAEQADHIVLNDPARVLAECEAKRWVITLAQQAMEEAALHGADRQIGVVFEARASLAEAMLRTEATSYADHEDYLREWKP